MSELDAIAVHHEANLERTGTFTLYADRLHVIVNQTLRSSIETSVPLASLASSTALHYMRSSIFNAGLWAICFSALLVVLPLSPTPNFFYAVPVFAITILAFGARRIYLVSVLDSSGVARVTIGEGKTRKAGLDEFVAQVIKARETISQQTVQADAVAPHRLT